MRLPMFTGMRTLRSRLQREGGLRSQIALESGVKLDKFCRRCRRNRSGAAVVEFAFIAPVFFLLIFGVIEFGRMVMVQQIITNASREGARIAVLDEVTESEVEAAVRNYLESARINVDAPDTVAVIAISDDSPPVERPLALSDYGDSVKVSVLVPFNQVSWLPSSFFGNGDAILSANTVMRRETVQ